MEIKYTIEIRGGDNKYIYAIIANNKEIMCLCDNEAKARAIVCSLNEFLKTCIS